MVLLWVLETTEKEFRSDYCYWRGLVINLNSSIYLTGRGSYIKYFDSLDQMLDTQRHSLQNNSRRNV